jgi:hypothetical protein
MEGDSVEKVEEILHDSDDGWVEFLDCVANGDKAVLNILMTSAVNELPVLVGREQRSGQLSEICLEGACYTWDIWLAICISQRISTYMLDQLRCTCTLHIHVHVRAHVIRFITEMVILS